MISLILSCSKRDFNPSSLEEEVSSYLIAEDSGALLNGNSQFQRWIYYSWDKSWIGTKIINTAIGGTTWKSMYSKIGTLITAHSPKVIVLYQGENEYNGWNMRADQINIEFVKYFDEVRRQNPNAHIVVVSMILSPVMIRRGYLSDMIKLNEYYKAKTLTDSKSSYLDITADYPASNISLFRPDSLHLNNYVPFLNKLKPYITQLLADSTPTIPDTTVVTRKIGFLGSSTIFHWDIEKYFPNVPKIKWGFPGKTFSNLILKADSLGKAGLFKDLTQLVIYAGDNDIDVKYSTAKITTDAKNLINKIWSYNPNIHIILMKIKPSQMAFDKSYGIVNGVAITGINVIEYVNSAMTNWVNTMPSKIAIVDTYSINLLYGPKRLDKVNYKFDDGKYIHWTMAGYDENSKKVQLQIK
jgi:hypothetical protein